MHRQPELKQDLLLKSAWVETQSVGKHYDKIFYMLTIPSFFVI